MLTVEKIGGTSMAKFEDVLRNIIIGKRKPGDYYNRIFVVSAYSGVTNWLLEHKKTSEPGIFTVFENNGDYSGSLEQLLVGLLKINQQFEPLGLDLQKARAFIAGRIHLAKEILRSMSSVLASGYVAKDHILFAAREILASIGEAHSAFNSVNILQHNHVSATLVDLCGFEDSEPLTIDQRIARAFSGMDFSRTLAVATGYTKGTEGIMREFDRGYSEITFSKIAVQMKVDEAVIHKEFHLSFVDPNIPGVGSPRPVGYTSFNVADQLADVGMEAIHPKASKPIEVAGINLRIKSTFEPAHPGTLISKTFCSPEPRVEIITGSHRMIVVEIRDPLMVGQVGFDLGIMQVFQEHGVSYNLKATSANSISVVIWDHGKSKGLLDELKRRYEDVTVRPVALLCLTGSNISSPDILAKAAAGLASHKIQIHCVSLSLSQVNLQFVLSRSDYEKAVGVLNDLFYPA